MHTINNKTYTEFDINKRCAEIIGLLINDTQSASLKAKSSSVLVNDIVSSWEYNPLHNPLDTDAIIDKVWDELMELMEHSGDALSGVSEWEDVHGVNWDYLMQKHNCTKLVAACICLIECYGGE